MTNDELYEQEIMRILRANNMRPPELSAQYTAYIETRDLFEQGYSTVEDLQATVTPVVVAMLDLENRMLTDMHAEAVPTRVEPSPVSSFSVTCSFAFSLVVYVLIRVAWSVLVVLLLEGMYAVVTGV